MPIQTPKNNKLAEGLRLTRDLAAELHASFLSRSVNYKVLIREDEKTRPLNGYSYVIFLANRRLEKLEELARVDIRTDPHTNNSLLSVEERDCAVIPALTRLFQEQEYLFDDAYAFGRHVKKGITNLKEGTK